MLSVERSTHGSSPLTNDNLIDSLIDRKRILKNNYYKATFLLSDLKNKKLSSYLESKTNDLNLLFNVLSAFFFNDLPEKDPNELRFIYPIDTGDSRLINIPAYPLSQSKFKE